MKNKSKVEELDATLVQIQKKSASDGVSVFVPVKELLNIGKYLKMKCEYDLMCQSSAI